MLHPFFDNLLTIVGNVVGIIYASTLDIPDARALLDQAVQVLLEQVLQRQQRSEDPEHSPAHQLWKLFYTQSAPTMSSTSQSSHIHGFPPSQLDSVFNDDVIESVRKVWRDIMGSDAVDDEFLVFADREGEVDEDEDVF